MLVRRMHIWGLAAVILFPCVCLQAQEYQRHFPPEEFQARWEKVFDRIGNDAIAIVQGAPDPGGFIYPRQTNSFYYLCGVENSYAYLLLDGRERKVALYLPRGRGSDFERVLTLNEPEKVKRMTGVDEVLNVDQLRDLGAKIIYTPFSPAEGQGQSRGEIRGANRRIANDYWDGRVSREEHFRSLLEERNPEAQVRDLSPILDELRSIKSPREIAMLRRAGQLSALAVMAAMRATELGVYEYHLDAAGRYMFQANGARLEGYRSITAAGVKNIGDAHYYYNSCPLIDGDLVLMDYAPDFGNYVSDIGRMWPVNGKFNDWQRQICQFILDYHKEILKRIRPGVSSRAIMDEAKEAMEPVFARIKFSKPIYEKAARRLVETGGGVFSHTVGMAVHDVGGYRGALRPGQVFAVDPQLRVPEEGLYMRIEDTVVVTEDGVEVLTGWAPWELDEIEKMVQEKGIIQDYAPVFGAEVEALFQEPVMKDMDDGAGKVAQPPAVRSPVIKQQVIKPPAELECDPFYQKYVDGDGLPILSSAKVADAALWEADYLIDQMLVNRGDIRQALIERGVRVMVMHPTEMTTDVPEQRNMTPKDYWDRRARGLGGRLTSCGQENLLNYEGDRYFDENILIHEFSHCIHSQGLRRIDENFEPELRALYKKALSEGLWVDTYAGSNHSEYWAEGVQSWFDCNRQSRSGKADGVHNHVNTREELIEYDPDLAQFIEEKLGPSEWRYKRPKDRNLPQGITQNSVVTVFEEKLLQARPLPLNNVRLLGGPLKVAQDLDAKYLLELEPDRMLAYYREHAGLEPKAQPYGGWDGGGRNLTGHIAGHYLSAVSLMWAATGDVRFKERADYLVKELKEVQDKHGDGYLSALEGGRECFNALAGGEIRSGGFDLNGEWSPWYTLHKTYGGLRDAYRYTGNRTALEMEIKFAEWAEGILSKLTDNQIQQMLNTEFGGMNEIMVDLYADTGDKRWLDLSYKFEHQSFVEPFKRHQDNLNGKHGNTQIPKMIGSADRYVYTGDAGDIMAASFFWDQVVQHHSFATGGHGHDEYFHEPDQLSGYVDGRTAETCNVYNMVKLTRRLFAIRPDAHYADFLERALFNHILGSIDNEDGRTCYMVPVGRGVQHEYGSMFRGFTCCVGSGMESHALHGDGIYYESGDKLWVNLYAPSTADWAEAGVKLEMETDFPEGESTTIKLNVQSPKEFTLALRRPYWAGDGFMVKVNGEAVVEEAPVNRGGFRRARQPAARQRASTYVELKRTWKTGDIVELTLPKSLRLEPTPDDATVAAIMWGPLVLAGDLGPERRRGRGGGGERPQVPVLVAGEREVGEWVKANPDKPGQFQTDGVGRVTGADEALEVNLVPFYRLHKRTYSIYWDLFSQSEWDQKAAEYAAEQQRLRQLEKVTVGFVQPGEMQPERNYNYQGAADASVVRIEGRPGRSGRSWFSFDMPVDPEHAMTLVVTYYSDEGRRRAAIFEILVDGQRVGRQEVERTQPGRFFDVEYAIPANLVRDKEKVTVRFEAVEGNQIAAVFGVRMIRNVK